MEKKEVLLLSGAALLWLLVIKPLSVLRNFLTSPIVVVLGLMMFSLGMAVYPENMPDLSHFYIGNPYADSVLWLVFIFASAGYSAGTAIYPLNYAVAGFLGSLALPLSVFFLIKYCMKAFFRMGWF